MADVAVRQAVPLRTIPGVELAATGTWKASTGTLTLTDRDFADAVAALDCPGVRNPVLKLGHDEDDSTGGVRWDGEPAVGWIANMRCSANGTKILGDYTGVPAWLAEVMPSAYPDRSIEIYQPFVCQIGHKHPAVITAVALLGVMPPGVGVLKSMQDVMALYTEDAAAQRADARAVVTVPLEITALKFKAADDRPPLVLRRKPSPAELSAATDFAAVQTAWEDELDALIEAWQAEVDPDAQDEILAEVGKLAATGEISALAEIGVSAAVAATAADLVAAAMLSAAASATALMLAELVAQGLPPVTPEPVDEDWLRERAAGTSRTLLSSLATAAGRHALSYATPGTAPKAVVDATADHLDSLTDRALRDQLGGALTAAQTAGRLGVMSAAPPARYVASEIADANACDACLAVDGTSFATLAEAAAAYLPGYFTGCRGRDRCRGTVVAVWDTSNKAAVSLEVRPQPPTNVAASVRLPIGDIMPATSGTARASVSVEDISRQYYESAGYSRWITQMHVDPLELIVADDADGKLYRVPVEMGKGGKFTFGEEQEVAIEYKDVKTPAGSKAAASMPFRWPTKAAALAAAGVAESQPGQGLVMRNPDGTQTVTTTASNMTPVYTSSATATGTPTTSLSIEQLALAEARLDQQLAEAKRKVERTLPPAEAIRKVAAATTAEPKTPGAAPAAGPTITEDKEASGMAVDAAKLREALGLAADASDDDVKAAAQAAFPASAPAAAPPESATPDPAALLAALPDNASVVVLDKTNYETLIDKANQGVQALAMARAGERDKVLEGACRDGRFPVSKLKSYKEMWDKNPDATRDFITLLPKNSIPTQLTAGLLGEEFDRSESDLAYEGVYGKEN